MARTRQKFENALEDDFNTPEALASLFEFIRETQKNLWEMRPKEAGMFRNFLLKTMKIMGFRLQKPVPPPTVRKLVRERELSRRNKQFVRADDLRKKVEALGYRVEDTPLGPLCLKISKPRPTT